MVRRKVYTREELLAVKRSDYNLPLALARGEFLNEICLSVEKSSAPIGVHSYLGRSSAKGFASGCQPGVAPAPAAVPAQPPLTRTHSSEQMSTTQSQRRPDANLFETSRRPFERQKSGGSAAGQDFGSWRKEPRLQPFRRRNFQEESSQDSRGGGGFQRGGHMERGANQHNAETFGPAPEWLDDDQEIDSPFDFEAAHLPGADKSPHQPPQQSTPTQQPQPTAQSQPSPQDPAILACSGDPAIVSTQRASLEDQPTLTLWDSPTAPPAANADTNPLDSFWNREIENLLNSSGSESKLLKTLSSSSYSTDDLPVPDILQAVFDEDQKVPATDMKSATNVEDKLRLLFNSTTPVGPGAGGQKEQPEMNAAAASNGMSVTELEQKFNRSMAALSPAERAAHMQSQQMHAAMLQMQKRGVDPLVYQQFLQQQVLMQQLQLQAAHASMPFQIQQQATLAMYQKQAQMAAMRQLQARGGAPGVPQTMIPPQLLRQQMLQQQQQAHQQQHQQQQNQQAQLAAKTDWARRQQQLVDQQRIIAQQSTSQLQNLMGLPSAGLHGQAGLAMPNMAMMASRQAQQQMAGKMQTSISSVQPPIGSGMSRSQTNSPVSLTPSNVAVVKPQTSTAFIPTQVMTAHAQAPEHLQSGSTPPPGFDMSRSRAKGQQSNQFLAYATGPFILQGRADNSDSDN